MHAEISSLSNQISQLERYQVYGRVAGICGNLIEVLGITQFAAVGSRVEITTRHNRTLLAEAIGFRGEFTLLMPFADIADVGVGCIAKLLASQQEVYPHVSWKGRVLNAFGDPIDGKGPILHGKNPYNLKSPPPPANLRQRVQGKISLGVKSLDVFTSVCRGQRMGIFAGSGVGKSMLIAMLTRYATDNVKVIGLIGERGREVQEFIEDYLGPEGLSQAVIVVATGDEPPLMRRQAAYMTMAIAEFYRDLGQDVLCIMDSVTRFAMAQRELGLALGEPPTTRGYPPSVYSELARLLERAGPGKQGHGAITAFLSVLVEGDDLQEPICDTVRGIVDGHIVLKREIASRGRYPAIDVLASISRMMPGCNSEAENNLVMRAKQYLSLYEDMADMIRLGAYKAGTNQEVDLSIKYYQQLEAFLSQRPNEHIPMEESYKLLAKIIEPTA